MSEPHRQTGSLRAPAGVAASRARRRTRTGVLALLLPLLACASPSEPAPAPAGPAASAEPVWTRIAREAGVPRLTLEIDADEVARQEALLGKVGFEAALRAALESLLRDGGDLESPLSLVRNAPDRLLGDDEARARVREILDQPTSRVGLVRLVPPASEDDPGYHLHRPEGQEDPRAQWVFYLVARELFDHAHWAVVPRDGGAVYNYGFN